MSLSYVSFRALMTEVNQATLCFRPWHWFLGANTLETKPICKVKIPEHPIFRTISSCDYNNVALHFQNDDMFLSNLLKVELQNIWVKLTFKKNIFVYDLNIFNLFILIYPLFIYWFKLNILISHIVLIIFCLINQL